MKGAIGLILSLMSVTAFGQCPITFSYDLNPTFCQEELLEISNISVGTLYSWDFCAGDIENGFTSASISTNSAFVRNRTVKVIEEDNLWYAFTVSQTASNLQRIDLGSDILNPTTTYNDLGTFSTLNRPFDLDMIRTDKWYSIVPNFNEGTIIRLDFNSGIDQNPELVDLGSFSSTFSQPTSVVIKEDGGNYFALITDGQDIIRLSFGNAMSNIPTVDVFNVTGSNTLRGLDLIKDCDSWIGLVTSYLNDQIYSIDFGTSLSNTPTIGLITTTVTTRFPANISLINENAKFYAFIQGALGDFYRIDFGSSISDLTFTDQEITDAVFTNNQNSALDIVSDSSKWVGFNFNLDNQQLIQFSFTDDCGASIKTSNEMTPSDIRYSAEGVYNISTFFIDDDGNSGYFSKGISVTGDIAPSITFSVDASRCLSNSNTFTPSNPSLTSYEWDFNGDDVVDVTDMTGADQSFDYSALGAGTYIVRLDVSDGTCDNFFEQEITIYDPPPAPSYSYTSPRTCINTDFTFTNTTNDIGYLGPLEYLWEFIDEPSGTVVATANTEDAVYAFETEGQKTVRLTSSIPGCSEIEEQTLMITPGPSAAFSSTFVCQGESMQFTNNSSAATSYSWDFGDGFMSSAESPSHVYTDAGNYFVTLTAIDAEGCEDTEVIEVAVSDSPLINFDFDIPCTSSDGIQFTDLTTVNNANVVSWNWFVDGEQVSSLQNPTITFISTGIKEIRLDVLGSNGCESSYIEDIEILAAPMPDFTSSIGCQGEESVFMDNTVSTGNPIVSWLWSVDGVNYGTQDISHVFSDPGTYEVSLEVTGQNFCSEVITKNVEIIGLPAVTFSVNGECNNELIRAIDESSETEDPVISRRWLLDGQSVGNGSQLFLENLDDASYELALELETSAGCITSGTQVIEINTAPESSFSSSRTYGVPNDQLSFTNTSTGGVSYQWLLDGVVQSFEADSETITFTEAGNYQVSLVAQNSLGCNDTTSQAIRIAIPEVDLSIGSFELVEENNVGKVFLEVTNSSNLPVELTEAQIVLENQFSVTEQIVAFIDVGETRLVNLNIGIPLSISEPSYFCVRLNSQYVDYPDISPIDNEKCLTIQPRIQVEDPFPNPVQDEFRLKVVVPESGVANLTLMNTAGKIYKRNMFDLETGLNNFFVEMRALNPGIYFVTIEISGAKYRRKVIKL